MFAGSAIQVLRGLLRLLVMLVVIVMFFRGGGRAVLPRFFQIMPAMLGLAAVFAMLFDRVLQFMLGVVDALLTPVLMVVVGH
jgi:hypothetical protein